MLSVSYGTYGTLICVEAMDTLGRRRIARGIISAVMGTQEAGVPVYVTCWKMGLQAGDIMKCWLILKDGI